jgi:hypothetical protein
LRYFCDTKPYIMHNKEEKTEKKTKLMLLVKTLSKWSKFKFFQLKKI